MGYDRASHDFLDDAELDQGVQRGQPIVLCAQVQFSWELPRHSGPYLAARGRTLQGRVTSAIGPDARRHDDGDAPPSERSGNVADGPMPP